MASTLWACPFVNKFQASGQINPTREPRSIESETESILIRKRAL